MWDDPVVIMYADMVRAFVIALAAMLGAACLHLARVRASQHLGWPYVGVSLSTALLAISALFTEVGRLHHVVTWRLPVNTAGVTLALWAVIGVLRAERQRVDPAS